MNLNRVLGFSVGAVVAGYIAYQIYYQGIMAGALKTVGVEEVPGTFGMDDVLKGAAVLGVSALAIKLAHQMGLPTATSPI